MREGKAAYLAFVTIVITEEINSLTFSEEVNASVFY